MPLLIPDDVLESAGLTEQEARVEIACRLFDAGLLSLWAAARFAGLDRFEFEEQLLHRNLPLFRPTPESVAQDLDVLDRRLGDRA